MRSFRISVAAGILTVVFAVSPAIAGQMPTGVTSPLPSPDASVTGDMPQGVTSAIDPVTDFALTLVQSLLSLF
jgi:hypothetical protein